ncbi:MAG: RAMP superfamily CRISPR-associated protein [Candidatus Syntrophopropionicum ammoniitolerans]
MSARWRDSRKIQERVLVKGKLILETPALLGSGDAEGLADMPLLVDPLEGRALLTGSSLAGALRNYLRRYDESLAETVFGGQVSDKSRSTGGQWSGSLSPVASNDSVIQGYRNSLLFVDDGLGDKGVVKVELRDGVAVDPRTRIAVDKAKYDLELLAAGASFKISFELLVLRGDMGERLIKGLAQALQGLGKGEIPLGGKKSRGFGRCKVTSWQVVRYDLTRPEGMLAWLANDLTHCRKGVDIAGLLGVSNMEELVSDNFTLQASFTINGSLLSCSPGQIGLSPDGSNESRRVAACLPDMVHLHSWRNEDHYVPVVSGTSLAGPCVPELSKLPILSEKMAMQ